VTLAREEAFLSAKRQTNRIVCKSDGLMKLAQTDLDSGIAVEGQAMSGLPSRRRACEYFSGMPEKARTTWRKCAASTANSAGIR
jgi:hypothetical protein